MNAPDFVIVGAGITGLSIAAELRRRRAGSILVIEKEDAVGRHASGRNSGILHAGIYYPAGSLKARFCMNGNRRWKEYCREFGLPLVESGKIVVPRTDEQQQQLPLLLERAQANGARVRLVSSAELQEIEPHACPDRPALYSQDTATVDPQAILGHLRATLEKEGVQFRFGDRARLRRGLLRVEGGNVAYGMLVNAAGAHADTLARSFGAARGLVLVPFRGSYRKLRGERAQLVRGNIYPVPDLRNPFLGVHFSRDIHGNVYAGPTAAPVFGREQYGHLPWNPLEALRILTVDAALFLRNAGFRANARAEVARYGRGFFAEARSLLPELAPDDLIRSPKAGIRPQLVDLGRAELIMDFLVEKAERSVHVLNAISPAFTCAPAFAEFLVDEYIVGHGSAAWPVAKRA